MKQQTFSEKVKDELSHYEYEGNSMKALLSSFATNNLIISFTNQGEVWELRTQLLSTVKLLNHFFEHLYDTKRNISFTEINKLNNRRTYRLIIHGNFKQITSDLQLNSTVLNNVLKTIIDQRAYLAGAFLSGGSINSIDKSIYHLEIRSNKIKYLRLIQKILNKFNISISLLKRKNNFVLYIKKATDVSDFLKIIGANNAMQELEDKIIARDYFTNIQRINNLDMANLHKTSSAGLIQIKMIKAIRLSNEFKNQPDKFKFYCTLRLQYPEASLSEMVKIFQNKYKINITRTGINHYVLKIKDIYKLFN
ncbi:MAG: DNA-binding protein WhiA [Mycoplasmataceae bacterium]|nr:DNA-binding protein WhiA [Mycoplasmataceae bacterium]